MKFPFEFSTKLIFRLLLPGAILAAAFAPLVHFAMHAWGLKLAIQYTFPFEVLAWGWLVVLCDMQIYMLFEGRRYWPGFLRRCLVDRETSRLNALKALVESDSPATPARLEAQVEYAQFPIDDGGDPYVNYPTRLGNLIEAFEVYPRRKYGLDAVFYWYRLWVVLDKDTREEIDNAQAMADSAVYLVFVLTCAGVLMLAYALIGWGVSLHLSWLPVVKLPYVPGQGALFLMGFICFVAAFALYRLSLPFHAKFGDLFKSVFDQNRAKLAFDDVVKHVERIRGAPYVDVSVFDKNRIVWRYLCWHLIRDEAAKKNFKVKDWPR